jgi:hypothetical protein
MPEKCLTTCSPRKKINPSFVAFADFHGVNTPTVAIFKLTMPNAE